MSHADHCAIMSGYQACTCPPDPVFHEDGTPWARAPIPPMRHRCWGQTWGIVAGDHFQRCPCGATSLNQGPWMNRNSRRPTRWWRR